MKSIETTGWVIVNGRGHILPSLFYYTRKDAIKNVIGSGVKSWRWWKMKYGLKAVKATRIIVINL